MVTSSQIRHVKEFDVGEHTQVSVDKKDIKCLLRVNAYGLAETFYLVYFPSSLTQQLSRMMRNQSLCYLVSQQ